MDEIDSSPAMAKAVALEMIVRGLAAALTPEQRAIAKAKAAEALKNPATALMMAQAPKVELELRRMIDALFP